MESERKSLPANAYTELQPGEKYIPFIPADVRIPEVTVRSVVVGVIMSILFSAAAAFLGLKIGQVFEAAIPIAIIAVGIAPLFRRKSTVLENVIIQSIGAASGVVVAGAIFTIPALFILDLRVNLLQVFLVAFFGGALGILFLIPFRRYFVKEMHGKFPFPEATATTEVIIAGEAGGQQAKVLAISAAIGGLYDFLVLTVEAWREVFTTRVIPIGETIANNLKMVFKVDVLASVLGLGYIVGLRYATMIAAGSFLSWFVLVPLVYHFGKDLMVTLPPVTNGMLISAMTAEQIFSNYVRLIGIGGIATAGIIGILKSSKIIGGAVSTAAHEIFGKRGRISETQVERTDRDLPMGIVVGLLILVAVALVIFFRFSVFSSFSNSIGLSLLSLAIALIIAFLFTTVAAQAIAIVGTNPVSGMTLMTLIISSLILVSVGVSGPKGMLAVLLAGGVVCTALSMAGGFITDLKIGYWTGATPMNQQRWKFLGTVFAATSVGLVIMLLNKVYGFTGPTALPAPQANAMSAVIQTLMSNQPVPWLLYGVGMFVALIAESLKISPLAFALGMYIPLELNTPILFGGLIAHLVAKSSENEETSRRRRERGTLIASGFIAGGALMGVIGAILRYYNVNLSVGFAEQHGGEVLSVVMFIALMIYMYIDAKRTPPKAD
ncbi:MAG: OPT family oligopeptide transporter [Bacteroidota bacterium]